MCVIYHVLFLARRDPVLAPGTALVAGGGGLLLLMCWWQLLCNGTPGFGNDSQHPPPSLLVAN